MADLEGMSGREDPFAALRIGNTLGLASHVLSVCAEVAMPALMSLEVASLG